MHGFNNETNSNTVRVAKQCMFHFHSLEGYNDIFWSTFHCEGGQGYSDQDENNMIRIPVWPAHHNELNLFQQTSRN